VRPVAGTVIEFRVTIHLSNDFWDTCSIGRDIEQFDRAYRQGLYENFGFQFVVEAKDHKDAAEVAFAICNSSPEALRGRASDYPKIVRQYRANDHRSLSVGDMVYVRRVDWVDPRDGRYALMLSGFERF